MFQKLGVSEERGWGQKERYMVSPYQYLSSILLIQFCILLQVTSNVANNDNRIW